ncbi:AEC family transporter [Cohnella terricola]|uniref:AEC family transporter n=1 Tax=Cohnella terricola TaxID=1289167 RepID=A0A559JA03_9BACL|nr:AEC family transporter [Cohnella terricola]
MIPVLIKASAYIFIILLGYMLKRKGFVAPYDYKLISKIVLNVTLPAAVVTSFAAHEMQASLLFIVLLGFGCNVLLLLLGYWASRKEDNGTRAFYMLNWPGYSIGSFTMPYVQSFLGPSGIVVTSLFDAGNAVMCTSGSYVVTSNVLNAGERSRVWGMIRKLFSSVPFVTYMLMLVFAMLHVGMPTGVIAVSSTIGAANGFLSMLMIGMMFDIKFERKYVKQVVTTLSVRFLGASVFAAVFYFLTPFSEEIRQALVLVSFSPISNLSPVFTEKCKGDPALSSLTGSLSILVSIVVMTFLLMLMQQV